MKEPELIVIMPVYNEEGTIKEVVEDWHDTLSALKMHFELHVFDDGSKDSSLTILEELKKSLPHLVVHGQTNKGHGPTILASYMKFSQMPWLFQVDSDNEVKPKSFPQLWEKKDQYDLLLGRRRDRQNPFVRQVVSAVAAGMVRCAFGQGVSDVNSPFRLMRGEAFRDLFPMIPSQAFAPNVIITGIACNKKMRIYEVDIPYQFRKTGKVSIDKLKLFKAAWRCGIQTLSFIWSYMTKK